MLIHIFNPDINLLKEGLGLFFAGAMLTIVYFHFKNIRLPVGLHFGNNYLGSFLKDYTPSDLFFRAGGVCRHGCIGVDNHIGSFER